MKFEFNEKNHRYTLDDKPLTGVTTILGVIAKPALIPWAVKMCADYVEEEVKKIIKKDTWQKEMGDKWADILKQSKLAWRQKRDKAGDIGTKVHDAIEQFIKHGTEPKLDKQGMKMFEHFRKWADENVGEWVESEKRLYSKECWFAGTVDMIFKDKEGKTWIGDIKTSNAIYPEYYAQMGGYHIAYDEMGNKEPIVGYQVIRIGKKGDCEIVGFHDTKMCKEFFMHALGLYKIKSNLVI